MHIYKATFSQLHLACMVHKAIICTSQAPWLHRRPGCSEGPLLQAPSQILLMTPVRMYA